MTDHPTHLFVYGTLLAQSRHPMGDLLRAHATQTGPGHIQARLYLIEEEDAEGINRYPGAVPSAWPEDRVHGMVYALQRPADVIPAFDDFEACAPGWPEPYEFLLRPVDVTTPQGMVRAASYLYTWDVSRATHLATGRYDTVSPDVR